MACWVVTGGCGFIGSHLVEALLRRGDRVRIVDDLSTGLRHPVLAGAELIVGDVADRSLLRHAFAGADGCFHLAAVASVPRCDADWGGGLHSNVAGTIAVLEAASDAALRSPPRVVYASSAAVYGDNPAIPLAESAATAPLSSYGAHKLLGEFYARSAWSQAAVASVGLRFFNVYGLRQDPNSSYSGVISIFLERLRTGAPVDIFGDGAQSRDFIYVGDVVDHLLAAMAQTRDGAQVLNVCTGRSTSVLELANLIGALYARAPEIRFQPSRPGDIRVSLGDPALAIRELGVTATTRLDEGLRLMLAGGG